MTRQQASSVGGDRLVPAARVSGARAYSVRKHPAPTDLKLDANEGRAPTEAIMRALHAIDPEVLRRYPSTRAVRGLLAARFGVCERRVLVTAGGDEAIERAMRVMIEPGREVLVATPTFVMIPAYTKLAEGTLRTVAWEDSDAEGSSFPIERMLAEVCEATGVIAVVTPNNPTGCIASVADIRRLSEAAPHALVLADLAYVEFADEDPTRELLEMENVLVVRTLSKAHGLAGVRIGYALGSERVIGWLEAAGGPYSVASGSSELALAALEDDSAMRAGVERVTTERRALESQLARLGLRTTRSRANFVWARGEKIAWLHEALAGLGISVRAFPADPELKDGLRITCPCDERDFARLTQAIEAALAPEAVLLDLDGVLADVSRSYRRAIIETASTYGVEVTREDIKRAKALGDANNDWVLTQRLLRTAGVEASLEEVTRRFEAIYQGSEAAPGLRATETLIGERAMLGRLLERTRLAIVTGRPRSDAMRFLEEQGIAECFETVVALEDGPCKPDPAPVRCAMARLGIARAWMVGDTPDDVRSARRAGVVPIGIPAPGEVREESEATLLGSGAARVLQTLDELLEILP